MARSRLALAFAASLILHLAFLLAPQYRALLARDAPAAGVRLEARLVIAAVPAAAPQAQAKPKPAARLTRKAAASTVTQAQLPMPAVPVAEPAPPTETETAQEGLGEKASLAASQEGQGKEAAPTPEPPAASTSLAPFSDMLASASRGSITFQMLLGRQGLLVGRTVHTWNRQEAHYTLESVTETVGLVALFRRIQVVQQSTGRMTQAGLVPDEFRVVQDNGNGDITRYRSLFDWQASKVALEKDGERRDMALDAGAQDLLSFIYQLVLHPPVGKSELHISTGKAYNNYVLDYRGEEKLPSPVGDVMARHYASVGPPDEASTELWLAPELGYLPVKVRFIDKKGTVADAIIQSVDFGGVQRQEIQRLPGFQ